MVYHFKDNYAVQELLETAGKDTMSCLISKWIGNIVTMSTNKFASNVVEKCLRLADADCRTIIVREIIHGAPYLITHRYGNFVLQTAVEMCEGVLRKEMSSAILDALEKSQMRGNVRQKWIAIANQMSENIQDDDNIPLHTPHTPVPHTPVPYVPEHMAHTHMHMSMYHMHMMSMMQMSVYHMHMMQYMYNIHGMRLPCTPTPPPVVPTPPLGTNDTNELDPGTSEFDPVAEIHKLLLSQQE